MTITHVYRLTVAGEPGELDLHATFLALASRGKTVLIGTAGEDVRTHRDHLAAALDGTALSDLLWSYTPIVVRDVPNGYEFEAA